MESYTLTQKQRLKELNAPQGVYNQVANYAYLEKRINIKIADRRPGDYFTEARDACLRFALTDEFYVGERHHDANPWCYPCSPNASGSGRMVMTILGKH